MNRAQMLTALTAQRFDLLVVGGGITGAGIAREAALRGLKVALVERVDFAFGTSSRSTKLIHGGLRYLKNFDFKLVREAVQERQRLLVMAPHLVKAVPFAFPVYAGDPDGRLTLRLGLSLYDWFAGSGNPIPHRMYGADELVELEPTLRREGLQGGAIYCDGATNDGRLTLEVVQSAVRHGAVITNYAAVTSFLYDAAGQVAGARVQDRLTGEHLEVQASQVIVAAGPWADQVRRLDDPEALPLLRLTKGVHLTIPAARLPLQHAVAMHGADGRLMFAVPAGSYSYVGTTDTDHVGDPEALTVDWSDVAYILAAANRTFPGVHLTPDDVNSAWAGLRPLLRPKGNQSPSAVSRDYQIFHSQSGLITIGGGKLTAFRAMASHIVNDAFPHTRSTAHMALSAAPLPGAEQDLPPATLEQWAQQTGATLQQMHDLAGLYGGALQQVASALPAERDLGQAEFTWLRAQLRHAVQHEMATRLEDVLARRTGTLLFSKGNGRDHVDALAVEMGELLGWSPDRVAEEQARCHALIDWMFAWQKEQECAI